MFYCSIEQKVFCVVSCCLHYNTKLVLKFSKNIFIIILPCCVPHEIEKISRQHSFILSECKIIKTYADGAYTGFRRLISRSFCEQNGQTVFYSAFEFTKLSSSTKHIPHLPSKRKCSCCSQTLSKMT